MEGSYSNCVHVDSGIPQGTVLRPLLFLCHLNDLPLGVDSKIRLFADDCLIYREINYIEDKVQLHKHLDSLQDWAENWGMRRLQIQNYSIKRHIRQLKNNLIW